MRRTLILVVTENVCGEHSYIGRRILEAPSDMKPEEAVTEWLKDFWGSGTRKEEAAGFAGYPVYVSSDGGLSTKQLYHKVIEPRDEAAMRRYFDVFNVME